MDDLGSIVWLGVMCAAFVAAVARLIQWLVKEDEDKLYMSIDEVQEIRRKLKERMNQLK